MPLVQSLRKRAWRLRHRPVETERLGARWRLFPQDWIDNRLLAGAPFEEWQIALCRRLIAQNGIDLFLDVGANIGVYTVLLGLDPGVPEIHAFEPVSATAERLRQHVRLNGLDGRVTVHQVALGREAGTATLHIDPRSTGLARLELESAKRAAAVFTATEAVRLAPLDALLSHTGRSALVKIDAEGSGPDVLAGADAFLRANRCAIQIETEPETERAVAEALGGLGYRAAGRIGADRYFLHPDLAPVDRAP
jgi:FkbM family methyltransferase